MKTPTHFTSRGLTAQALRPLSMLYAFGLNCHQTSRKLAAWQAPVPVVSIGNIIAGGSGKTPLVEAFGLMLASHQVQVAIVTRGYGGTQRRPYKVTAVDSAARVGDEAKMLFEQFKGSTAQVWVGANKRATIRRAAHAGAQLILLDDGFQSTQLKRDLDIVVLDASNPLGNGYLLPAGPLREPKTALKRADIAITLGGKVDDLPIDSIELDPILDPAQLQALKGKSCVAFCGIGYPEKFFIALKKAGVKLVETVAYSDHHTYTAAELNQLKQLAGQHKAQLICTHKDSVKLPADFPAESIDLMLAGRDWKRLEKMLLGLLPLKE